MLAEVERSCGSAEELQKGLCLRKCVEVCGVLRLAYACGSGRHGGRLCLRNRACVNTWSEAGVDTDCVDIWSEAGVDTQAALTPGLRQVLTQTDTLCGLGGHSEGSHAKISKGRCAPVRIPMYAW